MVKWCEILFQWKCLFHVELHKDKRYFAVGSTKECEPIVTTNQNLRQ